MADRAGRPGGSTPFDHGAIGDGAADDTTAVQAALQDSAAVHLPGGAVFRCTRPLVLSHRVEVTGSAELRFTAGIDAAPALEVRGSGSTLRGIRLTNPSRLGRPDGGKSFGVLIRAHGVTVDGCSVDAFQSGIVVAPDGEWTDTVISGNRVSDVLGAGDGPDDVRSARGEDRGDGICVWGSRATVTGNVVSARAGGDARVGIHAEALAELAGQQRPSHPDAMVTITGNAVLGPFRRGISSERVTGVTIVGNTIADPTWQAVLITQGADGAVVSGNAITWTRPASNRAGQAWDPRRSALMVYGRTRGVVVEGNTVRVTSGGALEAYLQVYAAAPAEAPVDCVFRGNTGILVDGTVSAGARLEGAADGIVIDGNVLGGLREWGVYGFGATRTAVRSNDLALLLPGTGVHLEARSRFPIVVEGNRFRGVGQGIALSDAVEGDRIAANSTD